MAGLIDLLIPRERKFFQYLEEEAELLLQSIRELNSLTASNRLEQKTLESTVRKIRKKSDEANTDLKKIINSIHQTFITPIDREEIKTLATKIAGVIDSVEQLTASFAYFKIQKIDSTTQKQIKLINEATEILVSIFKDSIVKRNNNEKINRIKDLENQADEVLMRAIGSLFANNHDPIAILKQKELYSIAEDIIDDITAVADSLEIILINNT